MILVTKKQTIQKVLTAEVLQIHSIRTFCGFANRLIKSFFKSLCSARSKRSCLEQFHTQHCTALGPCQYTSKCEVKQMNGCQKNQRTDRQESLLIVVVNLGEQ